MADPNPTLDIPPHKKIRLDSTASEGSEVLSQFLNDLNDLPDLSSLDGLAGNDTSGLINNTATANTLPQQQNTLSAPNTSVTGSLSQTPNHQGSSVSPNTTPSATSQVSSGPTPYSAAPPHSQTPLTNATPNATINMYANSPRGGDVNSSLYPGFNATGNAPSPQPMAVSTLADPTPALPSVSSTPAHGTASMAPSSSMQSFDSTLSRASYQSVSSSPMMTSSAGVPSMPQQSPMMGNMRGGAPMPPGARMGMTPGYHSGQGMHSGMHGISMNPAGMSSQMGPGQRTGMMGPMRVGMATPSHVMPMDGQMGRPGMANQIPPQGMHPQMRTQFHNYGPHGVNTVQQPQMGPRMMHSHVNMGHMGQVNPGMNPAMRRVAMSMPHNMATGGQQPMRMPNPGMVQSRPASAVNMYSMSAGQSQVQADNRFSGTPEQAQQMQQQSMSNNTIGHSPAPPSSNQTPPGGSQGGPGTPSMGAHQNDATFGGQQPNQGAAQNSGVVGNPASQVPPTRPQQQGTPNAVLGSAGGNPSLPGSTNLPGMNASADENPLSSAQHQQQPPVASSQPQTGMNQQPMSNRVPTPPPPGGNSMGSLFSGGVNKMQGAPQNQTSDPEKRKQIQQQLVLLLHAHKCQRRERDQQASGDYRPCTLPHCKTMKSVLNHMTECQAGRSCTYAHCATSRQIINHWRNCVRPDCPVCLPLKHPSAQSQKQPTGQPADISGMQGAGGSGAGPGMMSNAHGMGQDINFGMGMGQNSSGMGPGGSMMNVPRPNVGPGPMMAGGGGGMVDPNRAAMFQGRDVMGPGGYPNPGAVPGMGSTQSSFPLPIPPIMSTPTQSWHSLVNPDLRQHLVRKLVEAIYPVHDPTALRDARVKSLIQYAMKVERVMFEAAQSREEYYKLLAQKIYLIRKELEDRKRNKNRVGCQMPSMMNGGDPSHQGYPGQPHSVQPNSSQYPLPPTPNSMNALSVTGNPSPHPNSDLPPGFPPTPIQSIDAIKKEPNKMVSPTGLPIGSSNDPSAQVGSIPSLPGSVKTEVKNELLSPTFPPGSITGPPQSQQQQIKIEPNTSLDIAGVPPLPDNLPSVSNAQTPATMSVPSVKGPESIKRRESISDMPPSSAKPATPSIPMDTNTPRSPAVTGRIKPDPSLRKVFVTDELEAALRPVFDAVWNQDLESFPFQQPVDPMRLGIPDYFEVIKKPMDLTTISNRLSGGVYKSGWDFCSDMWLMFDNAWLYNKKTSRVYKFCTKLSEVFDQHINSAMIQLGYCCGMRYTYHPQVLYCYGKPLCTIPRDSPYYGCQNRYIYCPKCFSEIQGDTVTVGDDPLNATRIPKSQFKEMKNNAIDREPFVECVHCGRQMHQICVLHHDQIWPGGFQCDSCLAALGKRRKENKFHPRRLPVTKLGSYLEDRVNNILIQENSGAGHVTIRVVSSSDKTLDTRPLMRERFAGDFPAQFPYRTKAMFVFEEIDGVDVCFFGMHVQEYGSDCQAPNTRRVYISYLDSVHFFKPRHYRTQVYHEILIGYLDFCKSNGFMTAHIWACPPSEGDDYIFHCHPIEQKIPKPKRLSDWYRKMLDTAKDMNVIYDYKDIFKCCTDEGVTIVTELPYFEGDFWPNVLEEFIKELDQEAREREASEFASSEGPKKAGKRGTNKKGSKKASGARSKSSKKGGVLLGGDDLSSKVYQTMEKHKDVFFTVLLQPPASDSSPLPGTTDPDQLITCDLMDGRDAFLTMSRERHWEFSSLRRAKYSSIAMVYELHTQSEDKFMYNCNNCHLDVVARYHCTECDDFDLCIKCYKEVGHKHPMMKLGLDIDDLQSNESKQLDPQKARQASIEKCIRALVHATQCRDPHCKQPSCIKMKKVLTHTKECKLMLARKWNQCTICKQFVLLCISHAKNCTEDSCRVPLCTTIKKNLKEQRKQRTVDTNRFTQLRAARMTSMLTTSVGNGSTAGGAAPSPQQSSSTHVSPQNSVGKNPNPVAPSPGPGPRSVGKGGPKTPGTPGGKGGRMVSSVGPASVGMGGNVGSPLVQAGKPDQKNTPSVPPNVTVSATSASSQFVEKEISRVPNLTPENLVHMLNNPSTKERATQILHSNPDMKQRVLMLMRSGGAHQNMMQFQHNQMSGNSPMYNQQHMHPPGAVQYPSNYGHPQQQQMVRYSPGHSQYPMSHQVSQPRMPPGNYPARPPYQNSQQNPSTLQRMLTSGTTQQFAAPQQPSYNPQMTPRHLGPPPQYQAAMRQQPMPQTAGYPQVLGQQTRSVAPSPMGSHMPHQMSGQYGGGNQSMGGMDPMGMQTQDNFMYQQGQPHQYALNSSNNNNSYSPGDMLHALPPQDRLSKFVENL